jgi:tetratricopeptide (TPR) repeat protein
MDRSRRRAYVAVHPKVGARNWRRRGCVVIEEMLALLLMASVATVDPSALEGARDRQDRAALEKQVGELSAEAQKAAGDAEAQYRVALAYSYLAEVALELRDKNQAQQAAESGIRAAERAVALNGNNAEYYRVLGTLCGQVVPANVLGAFTYGKRAREAIDKALKIDPKLASAYVARGVGNYYLPPTFGGGTELAITDFRKAVELDPKSAGAYLWLGLALRKEHHNAEAREALAKSLQLDPNRVWVKEQLDKTPAQ